MRISDWSSDVCSSDLDPAYIALMGSLIFPQRHGTACQRRRIKNERPPISSMRQEIGGRVSGSGQFSHHFFLPLQDALDRWPFFHSRNVPGKIGKVLDIGRSEEHTSELQSLMRNSSAVFCF